MKDPTETLEEMMELDWRTEWTELSPEAHKEVVEAYKHIETAINAEVDND